MPGAIIPDDWDGSTYDCYQIQWPSSNQWRAILLGQISEPTVQEFWDSGFGDPANPALAASTAYLATIAQADWNCQEGSEPVEILPPTFFYYTIQTTYTPTIGSFSAVQFGNLVQQNGTHGYDPVLFQHNPAGVDKVGLWQYHVRLTWNTPSATIELDSGGHIGSWRLIADPGLNFQMSWLYLHPPGGTNVKIRIKPNTAVQLQQNYLKGGFYGHFLGSAS